MPFSGMQLGHYKLLNVIGNGGMGEVYLAEDVRIARQVAIKVVQTELVSQYGSHTAEEAERLLERELKTIIALDHPHILPLYDFGQEQVSGTSFTYLVMPFRPEGSLDHWLNQRQRPLLPEEVAYLVSQAADALQHAHDRHIIHQDVKPSNFLMRTRSTQGALPDLVLADFGISKLVTSTTQTTQAVRGTATYMPPEQWQGVPVPATDQYALAIMAYQLLTGRPPFLGRIEQVMHQHFEAAPPPPSTLNSAISPALDAVILRALAKQPADRFISISAFAHAFQKSLSYRDLHTTMTLSPEEARVGTGRTLTLPGGRRLPIAVPPGAFDGQLIQLAGQGDSYYDGGPAGPLLLRISIANAGVVTPVNLDQYDAIIPPPPPPPPPVDDWSSLSGLQKRQDKRGGNRRGLLFASVGLVIILILGGLLIHSFTPNPAVISTPTPAPNRTPDATATFIAQNLDPYPSHLATLALDDPLVKAHWWTNSSNADFGGTCQFSGDGFHAIETKAQRFYYCNASTGNFGDFDMDVQMQVLKGNCGDVLFRGNFTTITFYSFSVCSDGTYFVRYYKGNQSADATLIRQGNADAIKTGLNQTNFIGVVTSGNRFDLYVNQTYVGSVSDSNLSTGQFALAADTRDGSTEVLFTNVRVWTGSGTSSTLNAGATASIVASNTDPYPPNNRKLALNDPLSQSTWWPTYKSSAGNCQFTNGAYHAISTATFGFYDCDSSTSSFNDFAFEVQMQVIKGDCGGIALRGDFTTFKAYVFAVCQTGRYLFVTYVDTTGTHAKVLRDETSGLVNTGLNQSNTIGVVASGTTMSLYVNHNKIADINDNTYSGGRFSLIADSLTQPTEVVFSNVKIWMP